MNKPALAAVGLAAAALVVGTYAGPSPWSALAFLAALLAAGAAACLVAALRLPGATAAPLRGALPRTALLTIGILVVFTIAGRLSLVRTYEGDALHVELAGLALACTAGFLILTVVSEERTR